MANVKKLYALFAVWICHNNIMGHLNVETGYFAQSRIQTKQSQITLSAMEQ